MNGNWIEELLRRDNQTVESIWKGTFAPDLRSFLNDAACPFTKYIVDDFVHTEGHKVHFDMQAFDSYVETQRAARWVNLHQDGTPLPDPTPFNSAAKFLEMFYQRLLASAMAIVAQRLSALSEDESLSIEPSKRALLKSLTPHPGQQHTFYLAPVNPSVIKSVRDLRSEECGHLVGVRGTVTRVTDLKPELRFGAFRCELCKAPQFSIEQNFKYTEPVMCWTQSCGNRTKWEIQLENCIFGDWQRFRMQQDTSEITRAGTMPRSIDVVCRGAATDLCKPGDQIVAIGTLITVPDVAALMPSKQVPKEVRQEQARLFNEESSTAEGGLKGLRQLGVRSLKHRHVFVACNVQILTPNAATIKDLAKGPIILNLTPETAVGRWIKELIETPTPASDNPSDATTPEAKEFWRLFEHPFPKALKLTFEQHKKFREMSRSWDCIDRLSQRIAASIYGMEDAKKGVLLMLAGGVEKRTRDDRIKLRGDVNVCVVGDPGTAKSALLRFVHSFADRSVYATGKGSTAAGLTASVHRDFESGGDAVVEAGALILADNGVCCIDEFDKMDSKDQVALHEAMEQQTISISKAGVQATMNARASVLAACSPAGGKYNEARSLRENLTLTTTLLSRFDLIFVIVDRPSKEEDVKIAHHMLSRPQFTDFDERDLVTYMRISRLYRPRMSPEAKDALIAAYVNLRQRDAVVRHSSRITVRQLESMVRLSEAVAKLSFSDVVELVHARTAIQLMENSMHRTKRSTITLDDPVTDEDTSASEGDPPKTIPSDLFDTLQDRVVSRLAEIEQAMVLAHQSGNQVQLDQCREELRKSRLLAWLCEVTNNESELHVRKLLKRMESHDVLLGTSGTDGKYVTVHPNFDTGSQTLPHALVIDEIISQKKPVIAVPSQPEEERGLSSLSLEESDFVSYLYQSGSLVAAAAASGSTN